MRHVPFSWSSSNNVVAGGFANSIDSLFHCVGMRFRELWERRFESCGNVVWVASERKLP